MIKLNSKIISIIFHPIFSPTIIFYLGLILGYNDSLFNHFDWLLILLFFTIICPVFILFILKRSNVIDSYEMNTHKERVIPLLSSVFFVLVGFYFLELTKAPIYLLLMYLGGVVLMFFISIISYFYKISAHLAGIGGIYGAILFYSILFNNFYTLLLVFYLLIAIIVSLARFNLNAHTINQLLLGFTLGISIMFSFLFII